MARIAMSRGPRPTTKRMIYARDGGRCVYCQTPLSFEEATYDHRVPKARGGTCAQANMALCCVLCNVAKGDMSEQEWRSLPQTTRDRQRAKVRFRVERQQMHRIMVALNDQ